MAQKLIIMEDSLLDKLTLQAKENQRSVNGEIVYILKNNIKTK